MVVDTNKERRGAASNLDWPHKNALLLQILLHFAHTEFAKVEDRGSQHGIRLALCDPFVEVLKGADAA